MGKIKIGLIILVGIALVGLVLAGITAADSELKVADPENRKIEFVRDEIVVKFKGDIKPFRVIKVPQGRVEEKIKAYLERADVEYAEPNYIAYTQWSPNDTYYQYQWHLDNPEYGGIQMEKAWELLGAPGFPGSGVTVAIVDTGIRAGTDLADTCFVSGYDFVNNDSDPVDDNGHGTHVAGTVAQSTNNNLGVAGTAFNACLMPVKVLDSQGSGSYANVASGIRYAADNGAKVINLSLGGSSDSSVLKEAVDYAYQQGATVVAACGNSNDSSCIYPAAYDNVIAVGATQYDETKAPYSNYGSSLDLMAPGGNTNIDQNNDGYGDGVLQQTFTITGRAWRTTINWGYYFYQGTSMAAPHVSGVAALLIANGNVVTPDEVRTALQETAEYREGRDDVYGGYGLIDAYAALGWGAAPPCATDADCDDGLYCNGVETCVSGVCQAGTSPCNDGIDCTVDACDEDTQSCTYTPNDAACDDGLYCNGVETCDPTLSCQAGTPIVCDDGNECTADICDETSESCQYADAEDNTPCTGGVCCSGVCEAELTQCPVIAVICWQGSNNYLYRNNGQAAKFCKCASGIYGFSSYNYKIERRATVYQYADTGDNENWQTTSRSSNMPVYQVRCADGLTYSTNQDYYYPK